jgi:signal transduction histidine kinase/ActR/RegA family two-component response regulator
MTHKNYPPQQEQKSAPEVKTRQLPGDVSGCACGECGCIESFKNITSIFGLRAGNHKISDLASEVVLRGHKIFPFLDFGVIYVEIASGTAQLKDFSGDRLDAEIILNSTGERLKSLRGEGMKEEPVWTGLNDDNSRIQAVSCLGATRRHEIFLLAVSNGTQPLATHQKELLDIFARCMRAIFQDAVFIKDVNKANRLLKESSDQLATAETLAALTDMTSGMAHDFNNVIGAVIGRVQLMKLKISDDKVLNDLNKIEKLLLEGAKTVRSIQEFTTSTKYKKPRSINLSGLISEYFERDDHAWRKLAAKKNIQTVVRTSIEEAFVEGSSPDLTIVMDKLVENAVEHSPENRPVEIALEQTRRTFRVLVTNQGEEISEDIAKKIFYPFFTTKETRGAGMGLAIVHGIVGRHNGKCGVQSTSERGTVFEIELPKGEASREDSDVTQKRKKVRGLRILVVDDDDQIREVLTDMLAINGHSITACCDGFSALESFRDGDFDIVITDLGMAGMSGLDLAGLIHQENPGTPVALITGWGSQLNPDEVALKGVRAVVAKPFHLEEIHALVEKLIGDKK